MDNKRIFTIDMILIVGTLLILGTLIGYSTPLVISPINNFTTTSSEVLFVLENSDTLLIDDNIEFSSPTKYTLTNKLELQLEPGIYYWKAIGILESEIRTVTIESSVILEFKQGKDGYSVVNAGSEILNVKIYNQTNLIEQIELTPQEETKSNGNKFEGGIK